MTKRFFSLQSITLVFLLTLMGNCSNTHSADLSWTASTASGVTSYNVYRATTSGAEVLVKSGVAGTTFTDTGLAPLTKYFYWATAVCPTCLPSESDPSNEASGTTPADGKPSPPLTLTITGVH